MKYYYGLPFNVSRSLSTAILNTQWTRLIVSTLNPDIFLILIPPGGVVFHELNISWARNQFRFPRNQFLPSAPRTGVIHDFGTSPRTILLFASQIEIVPSTCRENLLLVYIYICFFLIVEKKEMSPGKSVIYEIRFRPFTKKKKQIAV